MVDASVWVSFFSVDEPFHAETRDLITILMDGSVRLVEPTIVLAEVGGALSRATKRPAIGIRAVSMLTGSPMVSLMPVDHLLGRHAAEIAIEAAMRGYDAVYVALAEREGFELITWDGDHLSRGSQRVKVHRPNDLLSKLGPTQ